MFYAFSQHPCGLAPPTSPLGLYIATCWSWRFAACFPCALYNCLLCTRSLPCCCTLFVVQFCSRVCCFLRPPLTLGVAICRRGLADVPSVRELSLYGRLIPSTFALPHDLRALLGRRSCKNSVLCAFLDVQLCIAMADAGSCAVNVRALQICNGESRGACRFENGYAQKTARVHDLPVHICSSPRA